MVRGFVRTIWVMMDGEVMDGRGGARVWRHFGLPEASDHDMSCLSWLISMLLYGLQLATLSEELSTAAA